jgi:O-methyltransferase domain
LLLLKFILHDWNDDQAITILRNCRNALTPGGRIAVIEMVVGEENPLAAIFDMNMFIMSPGRERSIEEFDALFDAAGLKRTAVHGTGSPQMVIEVGLAKPG